MSSPVQYVGDSAGKVVAVTVKNTGSRRISSVQVSVPSTAWTITSCPASPAGWSGVVRVGSCTFTSPAGTTGDIASSQSGRFLVKVRTRASDRDLTGSWKVVALAERPNQSVRAASTGTGLVAHAYSLELTRVVARAPARVIGFPCPAPATSAKAGSLAVLVICGRNHATTPLSLNTSTARLAGSFAVPGTFGGGRVRPGAGIVVVGNVTGVRVSSVPGPNKHVILTVGSAAGQNAPRSDFGGYTVTDLGPTAQAVSAATAEDTPKPVALTGTDPDGDDTTFGIVTAPTHGTLGTTGVPTCVGGASRICTSQVLYTPSVNYHGPDAFSYKVSDPFGKTSTAQVSLTIGSVNDLPAVTPTSAALTYAENAGPVAVDSGVVVTDPDSAQLQGATVVISSGFAAAEDALAFTDQLGITGLYDDPTGTLTLSGAASVASYQAALRAVTYENSSNTPTPTRSLTFQVTDAEGGVSPAASRDVTLTASNDAPMVTVAGGASTYVEGDPATAVDAALTVSDPDDINLEGATVRLSAGLQAGDDLVFVDQNGITGSYDSGTGVLTLTGTASLADYQAALRSVAYRHTGDDPGTVKSVEFSADDGDGPGPASTRNIAVTPVNDAPSVATSAGMSTFTEGSGPVAVDPVVAVSDPDSGTLSGATVSVTSNFISADDVLAVAPQLGISGTYDAVNGVLALTGVASPADYQTVLRTVTYVNTSDNPVPTTRGVTFQVTDASAAASNTAARGITLVGVNDAPVVTSSTGATAYTENAAATAVDSASTVTDADDTDLESAVVRISAGFQSGDDLVFVDQNGISGSYDTGTGVLTLNGTSSVANYQAALRSIRFSSSSDTPAVSKAVEFVVNDGDLDSTPATKVIVVTPVNDAPTVATTAAPLAYSENAGPIAADPGLTVTDPDSTQLQGATVAITSSFVSAQDELAFTNQLGITGLYDDTAGVLTLSGTATLADYQAALRAVTYENVSNAPAPPSRTLSVQVTDAGGAPSNVATRDITLGTSNDAATVTTTAAALPYVEGDLATAVDSALTVSDPDDVNLEGATVRLSAGLQPGDDLVFVDQNGISGSYNTGSGVLTLTGTSSVANYQAALRSVAYRHTGDDPGTVKSVEFSADDGDGPGPASTRNIAVTPVNDAPVVSTTAAPLAYTENSGPLAADPGVSVTDPDSAQLSGATVSVSSNFISADDVLAVAPQLGISGTYDVVSGELTLIGTASSADYQTVLRSVTYSNSSDNPVPTTRGVSFVVTDASGAASNSAARGITLVGVNDAPVVATSGGSTAYTEQGAPVVVDAALTSTDLDDTDLESAVVRLSAGFQPGDALAFVDQNGISGSYDAGTGVLTLNGTSSVANYQAALRSIRFSSSSDTPAVSKAVEFVVNDGDLNSTPATKAIVVTPVNDAPVVSTTAAPLAYTENAGPLAIDASLTVTDPDSTQLQGATVAITSGFAAAQDTLGFVNQSGISGTYNSTTGVLTLNGGAPLAAYQTALRAVTYENVSNAPTPLTRTLSFQATDAGGAPSNVATRDITVTPVNDAPTAVDDAATTNEDTTLTISAPGVLANDTDPDGGDTKAVVKLNGSTTLTGTSAKGAAVTINGDGSYSYNPGIVFQGLDTGESDTDTFTYTMTDSQGVTANATVTVTVTGVNDAPVANNDGPHQTFTSTILTVSAPGVLANDTDVDGEPLTAGSASVPAHGGVTLNLDGSFSYTPDPGYTGPDSFTYAASDGSASGTATVSINVVSPNSAPTASATSASGFEDGGGITVTLTGKDPDGDAMTFSVGAASSGVVGAPTTPVCDALTPRTCTSTVTYTPSANSNGTDAFDYTANDGTVNSPPATASITVTPVNDAPSFTKGPDRTVAEDSGAATSAWATGMSTGPANESTQTVDFIISTNNDALFSALPTVSASGVLQFTPAPNANGSATVTIKAHDDGGIANGGVDSSPTQTFVISVTALNDAPSFTRGADQTVPEDAGTQTVAGWATATSTGPANESGQTPSFVVTNDNPGLFSTPPAVSSNGTLTYAPAANANGSALVTVHAHDDGGTTGGGVDNSADQTFVVNVSAVNDAPSFTKGADQTALEDSATKTVLGWASAISAGPANESGQVVTFAATNNNNGLFTTQPAVSSAGVLTFTPAAEANGSATVTINAHDDGGTTNGGVDNSPTQTFVINVTAVNDVPSFTKGADQTVLEDAAAQSVSGWATALSKGPADESGQLLSFIVSNDNAALFSAQPAVSPTGTLTFTPELNKNGTATVSVSVHDNGGTLNGGVDTSAIQTFTITVNAVNDAPVAVAKTFTAQANMKISLGGLLGGAQDTADTAQNAGYTPTFTLTAVTPNSCSGCTISNINGAAGTFDFDPPAGGTGSYTLNYKIHDTGDPGPGVDSVDTAITITVNGPVTWFVDGAAAPGGTGRLSAPFKTLAAAAAVDTASDRIFVAPGTYTDGITMLSSEWLTGSGAKAADFDALMGISPPAGTIARPAINTTAPTVQGTVTLGSGNTMRGLSLGGAPALTGSSFGTLTLGSGANADLALSTTGQALNLSTGTIAGDFLSTTSSGGTNNVLLNAVSSAATSLGSGALSAATAEGFKVNAGTGTFSYAGTVANATGATVSIANKTGGVVTLSGAVSDTSGVGVALVSNTGATINLTGGVNLVSGTSPAFAATGGGTVSVTGAANTITSTTGTALNVANTVIGGSDLTFRSISSNGAAKGIVLDTTGASGNLVVTGNGGTCTAANTTGCSGGTIANAAGSDDSTTSPVGTGIVLNSTRDVSLTRMLVNGASNYGIRGTSVTNLTIANSVINGVNGTNAGGPYFDGSALFDNLTGTVSFNTVAISGGFGSNVEVNNTSGTLNATFDTVSIGANSTTDGNDGIQVEGTGTATVNATIKSSTFTSSRGDLVQYIGDGTGGGSFTMTGNTLSNNHPAIATGGGGVSLFAGAAGPVTMDIQNNTSRDSVGHAWLIIKNPGVGSLTGTFNGNTIGVPGINNSGSLEGSGLALRHSGTGLMQWTVTNNHLYQYNDQGIMIQAGVGAVASGTMNTVVIGNTLSNPGTNPAFSGVTQGIHVNSGVTPSDSFTTCVDFGANTITGAGRNGGTDFRLRQRQSTTVRLPGYVGGSTDTAAVTTFVQGKIGGAPTGGATTQAPGGGFLGTACGP